MAKKVAKKPAKEEKKKAKAAPKKEKPAKKSKSKKLILTHISQRYEHNPKPIEIEAKKLFKNVILAKDFDSIKF